MMRARARNLAVLAAAGLVVGACSSTSGDRPPSSGRPPTSAATGTVASGTADPAVQSYLAAVNRLCDDLLPKVIAVTHGGSLDVPVAAYLAQQPAHARLLADFDRQLAAVPVPPAAASEAAVFAAYVRYADRLDARRLAAARRGEAAYAQEIQAETAAGTDPSVTARNSAGFAPSCDAR